MFKKYRKKPIIVEAFRWFPGIQFPDSEHFDNFCYVTTIQGQKVKVHAGEWIIKESDGVHHYPCSNEEFKRIYEPIN